MDELKRLIEQIVQDFPKDKQGLPDGMREIAERAITDLFCPKGEKLTVPRMGFFDFCPCCGVRAGPEGFKIAWGIAPAKALTAATIPMMICHAGRTCITSMTTSPGRKPMPAAAADRLMIDIAAVGCVTHYDASANVIADALDGVGGA